MGTTVGTVAPPATALDETEEFVSSYRTQLSQLVGYFRAKGVPSDEAADMANETMVRLLVHLKRHGRSRTDLGPLVRTIARNLVIERVRRAPVVLVPLGDDVDVADEAPEPADHLLASERREAVREAIRALSPRHRHVVGMWMDGRTPGEIARSLGVKRNAVDAILHRARRSLAARLDGGGALGLVAFIGLRLRVFARRAAGTIGSIDPSGQAAPAAITLATMGLAAVLTLTGTPRNAVAQPRTEAPATAPAIATNARNTTASANMTPRADGRGAQGPVSDVKEYRVDVVRAPVTDPITGEKGESGVWIEYYPSEGLSTPLDPIIGVLFDGCVSSGYCSEDK